MFAGTDTPHELIPTRWSLIARLKNWDDQKSWREFFDTYWRLIYKVALKSGLAHEEAQDVVQETVMAVCRSMKDFQIGPARGSFKAWLLEVTRCRIVDRHRRQPPFDRMRAERPASAPANRSTATEERIADSAGNRLEAIWDAEWESHLVDAALAKLKGLAKPRQFQMFYLHVIKQVPAGDVVKALHVSLGQVYLAKHRVGRVFRRLVKEFEERR
jgi:RNA polymerase sigma-70 factor (ECF subfamily)